MTSLRRRMVGSILAFVILVPAVATVVSAVVKIQNPVPPDPVPLTVTAVGALVVNLTCAFMLARHRRHRSGLTVAAWLSARNETEVEPQA